MGLARTTPGHGALLYALTPIFVFLIVRARLGERATPLKLVGIAVAFVGVLVVLLPRGAASVSGAGSPLVGDLLILAAVVAYAVFATGGKPLAERYGSVASTGLITVSGALLYLPIGLAGSNLRHLAALSATGWLAVAYLVLAASVASYLLYDWVLARVEASRPRRDLVEPATGPDRRPRMGDLRRGPHGVVHRRRGHGPRRRHRHGAVVRDWRRRRRVQRAGLEDFHPD